MKEKLQNVQDMMNNATSTLANVEAKLKIGDMLVVAQAINQLGAAFKEIEDIKQTLPAAGE